MYALFAREISYSDVITGPDSTEWMNIIYAKIKSLIINDTWDLVDKPNNIIGYRTIFI